MHLTVSKALQHADVLDRCLGGEVLLVALGESGSVHSRVSSSFVVADRHDEVIGKLVLPAARRLRQLGLKRSVINLGNPY